MKNNKATIFNVILDTFENEDIKELTVKMIDDIPDYFFRYWGIQYRKISSTICIRRFRIS